jgi:hypothetical protein
MLRAVAQMIQLTYEPAFDAFHAAYRALRLRSVLAKAKPLHRDHMRILDFYQLFPHRIDGIRLMPQHRKYRRLASAYERKRPYGDQPDDKLLFDRMEPLQITALDTIAARGFINMEKWKRGEVATTDKTLPEELSQRIAEANDADAELEAFLGILGTEYELVGVNGLKARTGLLDYRHDAI